MKKATIDNIKNLPNCNYIRYFYIVYRETADGDFVYVAKSNYKKAAYQMAYLIAKDKGYVLITDEVKELETKGTMR